MGYQNLKMTKLKCQIKPFGIWIFLNCLWPDFDVALPIPNTYEDVTIIIGNK